jgi:hypothetical protein
MRNYPVIDEHGKRFVYYSKDAQDAFIAGNPQRRRLTLAEFAKYAGRKKHGYAAKRAQVE